MSKDEAWKIIEECRNWNTGQRSVSSCMNGIKTAEDDLLDARRIALTEAWRIVGERTHG